MATTEAPLLQLRGVSKSFGSVQALTQVDLDVPAGQVTALAGDNGAGKSVCIKTVAGLWQPDEGHILWQGEEVQIRSPREAERLGIRTIYQDLALCDNLDVVQNMYLGHERRTAARVLDEAAMEERARRTLSRLGVTTIHNIRTPVASLSGGQRQSVAVAKAMLTDTKLVIMDEPTAALGVSQTQMVLDLVRTLAGHGVAVLIISHNLTDVFRVADRIAVMFLGRLVVNRPVSELTPQMVIEYMTTGECRSERDAGDAGGLIADLPAIGRPPQEPASAGHSTS